MVIEDKPKKKLKIGTGLYKKVTKIELLSEPLISRVQVPEQPFIMSPERTLYVLLIPKFSLDGRTHKEALIYVYTRWREKFLKLVNSWYFSCHHNEYGKIFLQEARWERKIRTMNWTLLVQYLQCKTNGYWVLLLFLRTNNTVSLFCLPFVTWWLMKILITYSLFLFSYLYCSPAIHFTFPLVPTLDVHWAKS